MSLTRDDVRKRTPGHKQTIPYHNPSNPFHGTVIEMVMNHVELTHVALRHRLEKKAMKSRTKSLATSSFSFRALTRPSTSIYSRTLSYSPPRLASVQNSSGTSRTFDTRFTSRRSLNNRPVKRRASLRLNESAPDSASWRGIESASGSERTRDAVLSYMASRVDCARACATESLRR